MFQSKEDPGIKQRVFSVYDKKGQVYISPVYFVQKGEALRWFEELCNDAKTTLFKFPADFSLYCLGQFNLTTGEVIGLPKPEFICEALDFRPVSRPQLVGSEKE